jgi:UDP-3-O-[3-hydroxymyristoyl] N-acetylglucosamine deacetylase
MSSREIVRAVVFSGRGLHTGGAAEVTIAPAVRGTGVWFERTDLDARPRVPATVDCARVTGRRTSLAQGSTVVSTVEHLLAALSGLQIHDARIGVRGAEVPILDGSAAPFAHELLRASRPRAGAAASWHVVRPVLVRRAGASVSLAPGDELCIDCRVDFAGRAIGTQHLRWRSADPAQFVARLAPARTFGFLDEASGLRRAGLARGASLRGALVYGASGALNDGGTRFADEPVRHKVLDALGDLALLGGPLCATVKLQRCGHALLVGTLRQALVDGALVRGGGG